MLTNRFKWCCNEIETAILIYISLGSMVFGQSQWEMGSTLPLSPFLCSVTYGDGKYLAVGYFYFVSL